MSKKEIIEMPKGKKVKTIFEGESLTQQQFKDSSDINWIMKRYQKTGSLEHVRNVQAGVYMDLTELGDLQTSLEQIKIADEAFSAVPSSIRAKFGNSYHNMISFLADPNNHEEAISLGLMQRTAPVTQEPITPPVEPPKA